MSRFNMLSVLPFSLLLTAVAGRAAAADDFQQPPFCRLSSPPFIEYAAKFVCGP